MSSKKNVLAPIVAQPTPGKSGLILRQGDEFIVTNRRELKAHGICVRRSGREVLIGEQLRPVWEKKNWDYCGEIAALFREHKARHSVYALDAFLVHEIVICDIDGIRVERPQWCNVW